MSPTYSNERAPRSRFFSRRRLLGAGLAGLALGGLLGVAGPGAGLLHRHGRHRWRRGSLPFDDPEALRAHVEEEVAFVADWLDASEEQETKLQSIAANLVGRITPFAESHRAAHDALRAALTADPVDRAALEQARGDALALAGEITAAFTASLADALDVLTPVQRTKLAEHGLHGRRHHHRRG